jgi:hypothetical protein
MEGELMRSNRTLAAAAAATALALTSCNSHKAPQATQAENVAAADNAAMAANAATPAAANDPVASAMSAAPAAIARDAAVVTVGTDGAMTTLREGKNGWTCMADSPTTPGPDPMCMDGSAAKWAAAWIGHKPPPANAVGVMYMLEGGTDASNTDPYAAKPTAENDWVQTGPHLMVVGSKEVLAGYPSGAKPDTAAPYVMWAGSPYAHLMVPVK